MMKITFSRRKSGLGKNVKESASKVENNLRYKKTKSMSNINAEYDNHHSTGLVRGLTHSSCEAHEPCSRSNSCRSSVNVCVNKYVEKRCKCRTSDSRQGLQNRRSFLNAVRYKISKRFRQPNTQNADTHSTEDSEGHLWLSSTHLLMPHCPEASSELCRSRSTKSIPPAVNAIHPVERGIRPGGASGSTKTSEFSCLPIHRPLPRGSVYGGASPEGIVPNISPAEGGNQLLRTDFAHPSDHSLTQELRNLVAFGWYWGPISKAEAEERLSSEPDGSFLVRDSSDDRYVLSLSMRTGGKTRHTRIQHADGVFSFYHCPLDVTDSFGTVRALIEHSMERSRDGVLCYASNGAAIGDSGAGQPRAMPVRLTHPVSRLTQVRSLQWLCRFVIRQHVRLDLVQRLPLPVTIKSFVEEKIF